MPKHANFNRNIFRCKVIYAIYSFSRLLYSNYIRSYLCTETAIATHSYNTDVLQTLSVVEEDRSCQISVQVGSRLHVAGKPRSELSVTNPRCGSRSHPWLLEAQTGQQVNISLLDFSGHGRRTQLDTRGLVSDDCSPAHVQYGYIVDKTNKNNVSICSTDAQQRHKHVYQSAGNLVEIVLSPYQTANEDADTPQSFLLALEGKLHF